MTAPLVDTTDFQLVAEPGEDETEDKLLLAGLEEEARGFLDQLGYLPSCNELLLAYGLPGVLALYLARCDFPLSPIHPIPTGELEGEIEMWIVVGNLPAMHFATAFEDTRDNALETYCDIAENWAECILEGYSLAESYPIAAAPTKENAKLLLSRLAFIRDKILPVVRGEVVN